MQMLKTNYSNKKYKLLLVIPFIILFFDFYAGEFYVGSKIRAYMIGSEIFILLILLLPNIFKINYKFDRVIKSLLFFLFYLLILVPFSTNIKLTLNFYLRVVITFLIFIFSYYYIDNFNKLLKLIKILPYLVLINIIYYIYATVAGIGSSAYKGQILSVGVQSYASQFVIPIMIISTIMFHKFFSYKEKFVFISIDIISLLILVIIFRRTNFIILFVGLIILIRSNPKVRYQTFKVLFIIFIISLFYLSNLTKIIDNNLRTRQRITTVDNYYKEGRVIENILVFNTISRSVQTLLFGSGELFNSVGKYGLYTGDEWSWKRPIHNDYARILFGSGFVGLFLYLSFYKSIYGSFKKNVINTPIKKNLKYYVYFLFIILFFNGFSSGFTDLFYRTILFSLLGGSFRVISNEKT